MMFEIKTRDYHPVLCVKLVWSLMVSMSLTCGPWRIKLLNWCVEQCGELQNLGICQATSKPKTSLSLLPKVPKTFTLKRFWILDKCVTKITFLLYSLRLKFEYLQKQIKNYIYMWLNKYCMSCVELCDWKSCASLTMWWKKINAQPIILDRAHQNVIALKVIPYRFECKAKPKQQFHWHT